MIFDTKYGITRHMSDEKVAGLVRLVEKFLHEPQKISQNNIDELLLGFGWKARKKSGSHCTYHKADEYPITVPLAHGCKKPKIEYVKRVINRLQLEEWYEQNSP